MDPNPVANSERLTLETTKGSTVSTWPTASPLAVTSSVFSNAKHTRIKNSSFTINTTTVNPGPAPSLDVLYKRVAPHAILNAGGRADEVKCHPGTRKEVIGRIERWREDAHDSKMGSRMFWLSGPAGAGKSAIVQTVAEDWKLRGIHAANFFFFRSDTSRNHPRSLVATLLYQLFDFYPAAREAVEDILALKPRILEASLREQFDQLICSTFRSIDRLLSQSIVLLVDGLDECDSEEKSSQRQVLQVLDMLVTQNDLPFLVLVASRVEHQIKMAFNDISCNLDSIFLSENYSAEKDIHLFVSAEFNRIKRTHRLAPLDANWPSTRDVYEIVKKSSGQFIYAATVMRFISDSPAAPKLSLQRVLGTARIGSKSPFSQLDALYTYILAQADDQEALKDILHTTLFVASQPHQITGEKITLTKCLRIQDDRYTDSMIDSCIADVAAVARFDHNELIFYHASLADYLKDQARSGAYFFDENAFDLKIVPLLFKHQFERIAYTCLPRLKTVTLDIMRACNTDNSILSRIEKISKDLLTPLHNLCVRYNAVAEYKLFLYKWLTDWMDVNASDNKEPLGDIPYIQRCMTMVQIDRLFGDVSRNPNVVDTLRPESASDGHEIALWLQRLFMHMYGHYCNVDLGTYKQLLRRWMSWAVSNNIPFSNLHKVPEDHYRYLSAVKPQDIPYGQKYITMARIEHINGDLTQDPDIVLDTLHAESASDAEEITLWVQSLLQCIQREYYPHRLETYKCLTRQWISWANSNNIPLSAPQWSSNNLPRFKLEDIPYGQMYTTMTQIDNLYGDIWQHPNIVVDVLHPESTSDAEEVALWIQNLLGSIVAKFYPDHLDTYKRLIGQWMIWAVSNNIPLVGLDNLPDTQRHIFMDTMKEWAATPVKCLLDK